MVNNPLLNILAGAKQLVKEIETKGMPTSMIPKEKWDKLSAKEKAEVKKKFKEAMKKNNFTDQLKSSLTNLETTIDKANAN